MFSDTAVEWHGLSWLPTFANKTQICSLANFWIHFLDFIDPEDGNMITQSILEK
jgi:hypothetical protein